jgi:hypothetical protein
MKEYGGVGPWIFYVYSTLYLWMTVSDTTLNKTNYFKTYAVLVSHFHCLNVSELLTNAVHIA